MAGDNGIPTRLYVGFFSALDYWRGVSNLGDYRDNVTPAQTDRGGIKCYGIDYVDARRVRNPAFRVRDARDLEITLSPKAPLDILVSDRSELRESQRMIPHMASGNLPAHSFVQAREGVLVSSPEATFVQLAAVLTLPQLLLVGMELCGTYAFDGSGDGGTGFCQRPRLITKERLSQYIGWCHKRDGLALARQAVRLLMNNSGSPRESVTVLALTLPTSSHGLGLPQPTLNHRTRVTRRDRETTDQSQYFYDFYWTATRGTRNGTSRSISRVDAEYDSDAHHAGSMKLYNDAKRGNSVQYMGTAHVVITNYDLQKASRLIKIARQISRHIWHRLPNGQELRRLEPLLDDLLDQLKNGVSYPVSLDKNGKLPTHTRQEHKRVDRRRRDTR